jgi:hypothetical protein
MGILVLLMGVFIFGIYLGKKRGWPFIKKEQIWSIGIYVGSSISNLRPPQNIKNPVLTADDVNDVPAEFVADPFMIENKDKWYMFFEVMNRKTKRGDIGLAISEDRLHWEYKQIILHEPFHLSYPYVFESEGQFYMITPGNQTFAIRLYKAVEFPFKWIFQNKLIYGAYADPSIFQYERKWWLFASDTTVWDTLHLFYSDKLTGPWVEHPKSPVVRNNRGAARPGGRVIMLDGRIIRFAQDCSRIYGKQLRAFEITSLTETAYLEHEFNADPILKGSGVGWNADGMHHLDLHRMDENRLVGCVDGWQLNLSFDLKH